MTTRTACFSLLLTLLCASAQAEVRTFTHTVDQIYAAGTSADDVRIAAVARAKREVLEKAGTYLESATVVRDGQVAQDEILALAAAVLRTEVVSEERYKPAQGNGLGMRVAVKVDVDTGVLDDRVRQHLSDEKARKQEIEFAQREKFLLARVADLEVQAAQAGADRAKLGQEFHQAARQLTAVEWNRLGVATAKTDERKAIEFFTEAVKLDPAYAKGYYNLGVSWLRLNAYSDALKELHKAIALNPSYADAFNNRGAVYMLLGDEKKGCLDFQAACKLGECKGFSYARAKGFCRDYSL